MAGTVASERAQATTCSDELRAQLVWWVQTGGSCHCRIRLGQMMQPRSRADRTRWRCGKWGED